MNPHHRHPLLVVTASLVYFFLYAPIFVLILYSFNSSRTNIKFEGFITQFGETSIQNGDVVSSPCGPFHWFCDLSGNEEVINAAGNTLKIAFTSTFFATIIGTMAALAMQRYNFKLKVFSEISLYIPIVIPEIVMGIGILVLFSQIFTFLNNFMNLSGDARLSMGLGTVILSHIAFSIPFVTLVVQARLHGFDKSFEEAAMDLGAGELVTFWRVTLPMILPGVLSGALLAFTLSLDDFVITFFVSGPGAATLPSRVFSMAKTSRSLPVINALSTMLIFGTFLIALIGHRLLKKTPSA